MIMSKSLETNWTWWW